MFRYRIYCRDSVSNSYIADLFSADWLAVFLYYQLYTIPFEDDVSSLCWFFNILYVSLDSWCNREYIILRRTSSVG